MGIFREPLLHFTVAGALLFGGYRIWTSDNSVRPSSPPVVIGEGEVRWLRETFLGQWRREPTGEELQDLLATLVDEELLAREARSLGLDQSDTIVRRRLAQKMTFLVEDTSHLGQPAEDELRRFYSEHLDKYRNEARLSFRQVFFNPSRRSTAEAEARVMLAALRLNSDDTLIDSDPLPLDDAFQDLDPRAISALFGPDFARTVTALPPGAWNGPVQSGYGQHLVFVTAKRPGAPQSFDDVKAKVVEDLRRERMSQTRSAYLQRLREKYRVEIDSAALSRVAGRGARDGAQ